MNANLAQMQFEERVNAWDRHVETCRVCLSEGTTLCYEGQFLSDEVVDARHSLAQSELGIRPEGPRPMPIAPGLVS